MPNLLALQPAKPAPPTSPLTDEMFTIEPPSRMTGAACLIPSHCETGLTSQPPLTGSAPSR